VDTGDQPARPRQLGLDLGQVVEQDNDYLAARSKVGRARSWMGSAIAELGQPIRTAAIGNDPDGGGPYGEKAMRNGEAHESQAEDADRARVSLITPSPIGTPSLYRTAVAGMADAMRRPPTGASWSSAQSASGDLGRLVGQTSKPGR
jgi:hypothetical protein